ncbi:hypothetical protein [Hahella ganghwensis]|uniref:hypothetical protein n=1 Tax=Hahella ganghwensis TaxID=286420 RepID=UPI0003A9088B|nr:hypothetical protein [Hahella ganghwensis]
MRKKISKGLRYSIKVHLSTAFVLTLLVFGVVLGWFHYQKLTDLLVASSEQLSDRIADEVISDFNTSHNATANMVELLALSPLMETSSLNERFNHLPSLALALDTHRDVIALQVGFESGEYFIVRKLHSESMWPRFEAPPEAVYVVDSIETLGEERFLERFFFDAQLLQLDYLSLGSTEYDPRLRPWFKLALEDKVVSTSAPYYFYFIDQVGVTLVRASEFNQHVLGADITLSALNDSLKANPVSPSSEMFIVTEDGNVVASRAEYGATSSKDPDKLLPMSEIEEQVVQDYLDWKQNQVNSDAVERLGSMQSGMSQVFESNGESWLAVLRPVSLPGMNADLLILTPENELLQEAFAIRNQSVMITSLIVLLSIPLALVIAHFIAEPLRLLAAETQRINRFDYRSGIKLKTMIREIDDLAIGMDMMKQTIARFTDLIRSVSAEKDFNPLLARVTSETMHASQADGALIYLMSDDDTALEPRSLQNKGGEQDISPLPHLMLSQAKHPFITGLNSDRIRVIKTSDDMHWDDTTCQYLRQLMEVKEADIVLVPLRNRQEEKIGLLCLLFDSRFEEGRIITEDARIAFVNALSGFSAITIESRYLLKAQKELLESFMKLMAGAIDEKSPYTGGHCQRVPELTKMLARAACSATAGPFSRFNLTPEQWEELHIAAWMHDCGKVTTPEYVVDKATKLETIYDRIHEIRMRFEVIKQMEAVQAWKEIASGQDRDATLLRLKEEWRVIDEDWQFVARCNKGTEGLSEGDSQRLRRVAERTWIRTLDDPWGCLGKRLEEGVRAVKIEKKWPICLSPRSYCRISRTMLFPGGQVKKWRRAIPGPLKWMCLI